MKFYVSGDYSYQEPNYRNTSLDFQTGQVRSNIDAQISDNLKIGVDLAARREKRNNSVISTDDIFWEAFMAYPWVFWWQVKKPVTTGSTIRLWIPSSLLT